MSNSLVDQYRSLVPNDPRSDGELTQLFGQQNDQDGRYNSYPDFVQQYQAGKGLPGPDLTPRQPGLGEEFTRGVSRGTSSLESTAAGLGALAAGAVGADRLKAAALQKYRDIEESSAKESPAAVPNVEGVNDLGSAAKYVAGKAGELIPNIAEAGLFSAAGAAAGTAAEPGGGTVAGGAAGAMEGFLARKAAKSLLETAIKKASEEQLTKWGLSGAAKEVAETQLSKLAKGEAVDNLLPALLDSEGKGLLADQAGAVAKKFGANAANLVNFYGQGAGGEYGKLQGEDGAGTASLIAGLGSAGSILLPAAITSKLFPGVGEQVANSYIRRLATDAAKEIPMAAGGMGLMEVANIAADRYADPEKRDQPLTKEELSRILNAAVVGAMAGGAAAPLTAIRPQRFDPVVESHFANVSDDRKVQLAQLKARVDGPDAKPSEADLAAVRTLSPEESQFYAVAKPELGGNPTPTDATATQGGTTEEPPPTPPEANAPESPAGTGAASIAASEPSGEPVTQPDLAALNARKRAAAAVSVAQPTDPLVQAARAKVKAAAAQTETSPTIQQKLAGNYPKGHVKGIIPGFEIAIESPSGSERSGVGPDGTPWRVEMPGHYGQILGTKDRTGEPVDVTIGPNPASDHVFVIDQKDPKTGDYDEPKSFVGYESQVQAEVAYDASFSDGSGPERRGATTAMTKAEFVDYLKDETRTKKALKYAPEKSSTEPLNEGGPQPEVAPQLEGKQAPAAEGGQGVPAGEQGEKPKEPARESAPEPKSEPVQTAEPVLKPEEVDVEHRGTYSTSARGRKGGGEQTVQPAFFRPEGRDVAKLSESLLSESSPKETSASPSVTHRVTSIMDRETGRVHNVSTFRANGKLMVAKFGEDIPTRSNQKAVTLDKVLSAKSGDGMDRYELIGSSRTAEPTSYLHDVYPSKEAWDKEFAGPIEERQKAIQSSASAQEVKAGPTKPEEVSLDDATEEELGTTDPELAHEAEPLDLKDHEVKALIEKMPRFTVAELTDAYTRGIVDPELSPVLEKIARSDPMFFARAEKLGTAEALKEYGYTTDSGKSEPVEHGPAGENQNRVEDAQRGLAGGVSGPSPDLPSGKNSPGQPRQESGSGNKVPNPPAKPKLTPAQIRALEKEQERKLMAKYGLKSRLPEGQEAEQSQLVNNVLNAARQAGINVRSMAGEGGEGAYDPSNRTLYHVLGDQVGSHSAVTPIHEIGHDVLAGIRKENPKLADQILKGIDHLTDEALGIDLSADSRIRSADPANLGKEGVNEERLVESTAMKIVSEGVDPTMARGIAEKFVRSMKELYLRGAMEIQRWLGWEPSADLARRYFENRVKRLLAGDTSSASFIDWLGVGKWSTGKQRMFEYPSTRSTAERFSSDGRLQYETVPDLSPASVRFNLDASNQLKFRKPGEADPYSRVTDVERRAAVINHAQDLIAEASKGLGSVPELAEELKDKRPEDYLRKLFKLPDPATLKDILAKERETDESPVQFDKEKRIEDFNGKANRDQAYREAYTTTQGLLNRAEKVRAESSDAINQAAARTEKLTESLRKIAGNLKELKEIQADKTKSVKNAAMLEGRYKRRVQELRRDIAASGRDAIEEKARVAAIDAVLPTFMKEHARLSGELQVRPDFVFRDKAQYNVPEKPNATSEELSKSVKKLALDSTGKMTTPEEVQEHLTKMKQFLDYREQQATAGNNNALDSAYQAVNQQFHELYSKKNFSVDVAPFSKWSFALKMLGDGRRMAEAFGTQSARSIMRRLNHYTSITEGFHSFNERMGLKTGRIEDELLDLAPGMDRDHLRNEVLSPVRDELQKSHDLEEQYAGDPNGLKRELFKRVRTMLLDRDTTGPYIEKTIDQFMPKLQHLMEHQREISKYWVDTLNKNRMGVEDVRLKGVVNPATGEREVATRRHLDIGAYSFPRKLHSNFSIMVRALRASKWDDLKDMLAAGPEDSPSKLEEAYAESPDKSRALLSEQFNNADHSDQVQNEFFRNIAEMSTTSAFDAPGSEGQMPADPGIVKEALKKANYNDPVAFAEHLADAYDEPNKGKVLSDVMRKLYGLYNEANGMFRKYEPSDAPEGRWAIKGMSPDALIDARTIEHMPGAWFDYHAYDRRESFSMSQRLATEIAFGRGQKGLASDFETLNREVTAAQTRVRELTKEIKRNRPLAKQKEIDAFLKQSLGDKYDATTKQAARYKMVDEAVRGLSTYFRKDMAQDPTFNWLTRSAHTLGMMLVNQPASAINMLEQLFGLHLRYGAGGSVLNATGKTLRSFTHDAIGSLASTIGIEMGGGWDHQLYNDLNLGDAEVVRRFKDVMVRQQGETIQNQLLRGITETMGMGINRLGEKSQYPLFRPLQPFTMAALLSDKALTQGLWRYTGDQVARATEYFKAHPESLEDKNFKLTAEHLGLRGLDKDGFNRLNKDMQDWGANFDDMVRGSIDRADGKPFSNDEALKLYALSIAQVSSESSLSTMPTGFYNNPIIKVAAPLLGWSFRRAQVVADLAKTPQGKYELMSIASALAGLSVAAGGGLGVSALVNLYSDDLLGKKRNLRPMIGPDAGSTALGVMENLNRVGTLGIFGEALNGLVNVGTGGDNRVIDVDKRIVALSALGNIQDAISTMINQHQADYAHVIRPLFSSMGGGGMLQYMQLANRALGMDNAESRVVARTNARNWLRAAGRDLDMDVREMGGSGGYSNATTISPALTRMELAAYGNDGADFHAAYVDAVQAAKESGNPDPVDYVKRAFTARNPLKSIFRTAPSEVEYRRLLNAMPQSGATDVMEAVRAFNAYSQQIGARPFEGRTEKPSPPLKLSLPNEFRERAMSALR